MAELKTQKTKLSPAKFVAAIQDDAKRADAKELLKIFKDATGMSPKMWGEPRGRERRKAGAAGLRGRAESFSSRKKLLAEGVAGLKGDRGIIGYGEYHYKSERSRQEGDWPLTGFSPRAANFTLYIMPGFKDFKADLKKLGKHKISGGSCIYIKRVSDIDVPTLKKIIKKSVAMMQKKYQ